jgi:dihydroceramide fatty acyl 2-hydroxylase
MDPWFSRVLALGLGAAAWPFVEYAVHGLLSHRFRTPISSMHWSHHVEHRRVRTPASAWLPTAAVLYALLAWPLGADLAAAALLGLIAGFMHYERVHWRIHFRAPRNAREARLRQHHLAHHYCNPRAYYGVTNNWTDRLFMTLPATWRSDYARTDRHSQ